MDSGIVMPHVIVEHKGWTPLLTHFVSIFFAAPAEYHVTAFLTIYVLQEMCTACNVIKFNKIDGSLKMYRYLI